MFTPLVPRSRYDYFFKVLMLGYPGVGMRSLRFAFCDHNSDTYLTAVGSPERKVEVVTRIISFGGSKIKLHIWGKLPRDRFRTYNDSNYWHGASGQLLVYDISDQNSFLNITKLMREVVIWMSGTQGVLVGNKCDLTEERTVSTDAGRSLAESLRIPFVETSAKDSIGIEEALFKLTGELLAARFREHNAKQKSSTLFEVLFAQFGAMVIPGIQSGQRICSLI